MKLSLKKLLAKILEYISEDNTNHVLWTGGYYMNASQKITLSEPVSSQKHGIVLVWSGYSDSTVHDWNWQFQFVPKWFTKYIGVGDGFYFIGRCGNLNSTKLSSKYVYLSSDTTITGHASNTASGTNFDNSLLVLRAVIGV